MSQEMVTTLSIVGFVALMVGFFIGRTVNGSGGEQKSEDNAEIKAALAQAQQAQQELADYKTAVSEHFGKTADLVDSLTQSYKGVFEYLGSSAKSLLSEEQVQQHIASRADKAITLTYLKDDEDADGETADEQASQAAHSIQTTMQAAQAEVQSQSVVAEVKQEAKQMAEAISHAESSQNQHESTGDVAATAPDNKVERINKAGEKGA